MPMEYASTFLRLAIVGMWFAVGINVHGAGKGIGANAEVRGVIQSQLEAFRKNDFKAAYGLAHPGVKGQFTPFDFEQMVRKGFPQMLKPGTVAFSDLHENEAGSEIQAIITDEKGRRSGFRYILIKDDGNWRIAAVVPIELPDVLA